LKKEGIYEALRRGSWLELRLSRRLEMKLGIIFECKNFPELVFGKQKLEIFFLSLRTSFKNSRFS